MQDGEDYLKPVRNTYLARMVICEKQVILAAGGMEICVLPLPRNMYSWGKVLLAFLGLFYTFSLEYPQGLDVGLLILQCTVLMDTDIHQADRSPEFEKCIKKYEDYTN